MYAPIWYETHQYLNSYVYWRDQTVSSSTDAGDKWAVKVADEHSISCKNMMKRIDWELNGEIKDEIKKATVKYNK